MSDPIAPAWLVFPLAAFAMIVTAGYLIALREAPEGALPPRQTRLRTATGWLTLITLPLTAYGFGVASTASPKTFMLVWLIVVALLAMIFLLASIDLLTLAAERRRLLDEHRKQIRSARSEMVRLASGASVPTSDVAYSHHEAWSSREGRSTPPHDDGVSDRAGRDTRDSETPDRAEPRRDE